MAKLEWETVKAMPWRARNAAVEAAVRELLGRKSATLSISTWELAALLAPAANETEVGRLSQLLSRMAKFLFPIATHDGEEIIRHNKRWRRWVWHGQKG